MSKRFLAGLVGAICAGCLMAPSAFAADTLDQQQTDTTDMPPAQIDGTQSIAQTFTAGLTGRLTKVELLLAKGGSGPTVPLVVQIRDASGGNPGGTTLASQNLAAPAPDTNTYVPVTFSAPATVTAGTQYSIVAFSPGADVTHYWTWTGSDISSYSGGGAFFQLATPPGPTWIDSSTFVITDQAFKTYVDNSPLPTPATGPTGQRAAALKKCKKKHSSKAKKKCKKKARKLPV